MATIADLTTQLVPAAGDKLVARDVSEVGPTKDKYLLLSQIGVLSLAQTWTAINTWTEPPTFIRDANPMTITIDTYRNSASQNAILARGARGTLAVPLVSADSDALLRIIGQGYSPLAGAFLNAAQIDLRVDGTPNDTATDMPGRIMFYTTPNGSATLAERMRINNAGDVGIGTTGPLYRLHIVDTNAGAKSTPLLLHNASDTNNSIVAIRFAGRVDTASQAFRQGEIAMDPGSGIAAFSFALTDGVAITEQMRISGIGEVGIGIAVAGARLAVDQNDASGAVPTLALEQADVSEELIEFRGAIATGNPIEAKGAKTLTTTHFIKVSIEGVGMRYLQVGTIA